MEHVLYGAVLVILAGVAVFLWRKEHLSALRFASEKDAIAIEKDAIEVEERRMFGFLHGWARSCRRISHPPTCIPM